MRKLRLNEVKYIAQVHLSNVFGFLENMNISSLIKMCPNSLNYQKLPSLSTKWRHRTVLAGWHLYKLELTIAGPSAASSFCQRCWVRKVFCQLIISDWLDQKRAKESLNQGSGNRSRTELDLRSVLETIFGTEQRSAFIICSHPLSEISCGLWVSAPEVPLHIIYTHMIYKWVFKK